MAVTVSAIGGAETGGIEEFSTVVGSPVAVTTPTPHAGGGDDSWHFPEGVNNARLSLTTAEIGIGTLIGVAIQIDATPTSSHLILRVRDTSLNVHLGLLLNTDRTLTVEDSTGTGRITSSGTLTVDAWNYVEIWFQRSATGNAELWIDGTSEGTTTSQDFDNGGADTEHITIGNTSSTGFDIYFDDIYILTDAVASDRYGNFVVKFYEHDQTSADPDNIAAGTGTLDTGTWDLSQERPQGATAGNIIEYTATALNGGWNITDDSTNGGPNGDGDVTDIKVGKWVYSLSRGNGSSTTHQVIYGNSADSPAASSVTLTTSFAVYERLSEATNFKPETNETLRIGMLKSAGGRDIICADMWPMIGHVPSGFAPDMAAWRFYDDDAGEAASTPLEAEDTDEILDVDGGDVAFQFRIRVDETGGADGAATDDYQIQYSKNSGSFTNLTTTDSGDGIKATASGLTNGAATTNRAANGISDPGAGSFVASTQSTDGLMDNFQLTADNFTETPYGITVVAANVSNGNTFDFQLSTPTGVTNTVIPQIVISKTVVSAGAPSGLFMLGMGT